MPTQNNTPNSMEIEINDIYENVKANSLYSHRVRILGKHKTFDRDSVGFMGLDDKVKESLFTNAFFERYKKLNNVFSIKSTVRKNRTVENATK